LLLLRLLVQVMHGSLTLLAVLFVLLVPLELW
jgi:hypothetical protein